MDQQGSTPGDQGDQLDHSPQQTPADNAADNQQPSQDDQSTAEDQLQVADDQAYGNGESSGAPSQTTETDDDTQQQDDDQSGQTDENQQDSVDPELEKWASSQNLQLNTPTEIALAKRLRDTQNWAHNRNQGQDNESGKSTTDIVSEPTSDGQTSTEAKLARLEFFDRIPEARQLEGQMADYAWKLKESGDEAGFEYYRNNWDQLYAIVKANQAEAQSNDSYETGRKDERTNLARKQQASAPTASAVDSTPKNSMPSDEEIGNMSQAQYNEFRKNNPDWDPFRA